MEQVQVQCCVCEALFSKSRRRVNEANKYGWKYYCSLNCHGLGKSKSKLCICARAGCNVSFKRSESLLKTPKYCSRSCAAAVNNIKYPKRIAKIGNCLFCGKLFKGLKKFCSIKCKNLGSRIPKGRLVSEIISFYEREGYLPTKHQFPHYSSIRNNFGSWNKAVLSAGLLPRNERFSKKQVAKDGHMCDSLCEKIVDDWFFTMKIPHLVHVPYKNNEKYKADFVVGDVWIEFFGLVKQLKSYDRIVKMKRRLAKDQGLIFIELYMSDLFPKNKLPEKLEYLKLIRKH